MKRILLSLFLLAGLPLGKRAAANGPPPQPPRPLTARDLVILYEHADFGGRFVALQQDTLDLVPLGFNDMASSIRIRNGYQATFFEDANGKGEYFTLNCPLVPIGLKQSDYCEFKNLANDIATGTLCELRGKGAKGCVPWWNDRITGVGRIGPADPTMPQGRLGDGHVD